MTTVQPETQGLADQPVVCRNCGAEVTQNYCPNCGQPVQLKRIDGHYIAHEIQHVLHFEKGILYTVRELLINPGRNVRHFLTDNRSRLVKPVIFIIVTSLIYTLVLHFFHIEDAYIKFRGGEGERKSITLTFFKWVTEHYGYANIMMGVLIALFLKLFFRKADYNFFEILILLCFTMGMNMLILAVFALIQGIVHANLMGVGAILGFAYCTWAIGQFFGKGTAVNYLKAFAAYLLGFMIFIFMILGVGLSLDNLLNR
ncbi:zinc ribbon domain-containing protein [Spirosoma montaniterrae]|uniref:zinc ribbon domain-containing protein n=1 Tax=Spirosoma montaniterrae TaxID=1178516 RepID=UPI0009F819D8|nr:DUF3667 domain-containing protein [Spirosoma montaniterrae]